jgi:Ca2+-binding RTX toxin-like protein
MSITPWSPVITATSPTFPKEFRTCSIQLNDGSIILSYMSSDAANIFIQRFTDTGIPIAGPINTGVNYNTLLAHDNQDQARLAALTDGGFVLVYQSGSAVVAQKYLANGTANGGALTISANSVVGDVSAMPNGNFAVAHGGQFNTVLGGIIGAAPYDNPLVKDIDVAVSATRIATIRDVEGFGGVAIRSTDFSGSNQLEGPSFSLVGATTGDNAITALSSGSFVGVFEEAYSVTSNIRALLAGPDGSSLGGSILLASSLHNVVGLDVQGLASGGFAICYASDEGALGGATSSFKTVVRVFNADGSSAGPEFVLEKIDPTNDYFAPELTSLSDGRLLVTWTDFTFDNAAGVVKMQILDPRDGYFVGTAGIDKIYGHDGRVDEMHGGAGSDTIYGLAGADILYGDAGTDFLYGGRGDDTTRGGADNDYLYGDLGDDEQYGELGNDLLYSGRGADLLDGGTGSDTAYYTSEKTGAIINLLNQLLNAGSADGDTFVAVERFFGSEAAADNITGDNVSNTILGNGGADIINGAGGADVLRGGTGADTINGGTESDLFQYTALNEVGDSIINFEAIDNFQFARTAFGNLAGTNVAAINFLSVASGHAATTAAHRFIFDQAVDQLWYDADGNAGGAAVMVADISNNINITNLDLLLM